MIIAVRSMVIRWTSDIKDVIGWTSIVFLSLGLMCKTQHPLETAAPISSQSLHDPLPLSGKLKDLLW